jgi:hypothetical protein
MRTLRLRWLKGGKPSVRLASDRSLQRKFLFTVNCLSLTGCASVQDAPASAIDALLPVGIRSQIMEIN